MTPCHACLHNASRALASDSLSPLAYGPEAVLDLAEFGVAGVVQGRPGFLGRQHAGRIGFHFLGTCFLHARHVLREFGRRLFHTDVVS